VTCYLGFSCWSWIILVDPHQLWDKNDILIKGAFVLFQKQICIEKVNFWGHLLVSRVPQSSLLIWSSCGIEVVLTVVTYWHHQPFFSYSTPLFLKLITSPSPLLSSTFLLGVRWSLLWSSLLLQWAVIADSSIWSVIMVRYSRSHFRVSLYVNRWQ